MPPNTQIMGIVNVTPDSFSSAGGIPSAKQAVAQVYQQFEDGADMVDIGAESTRPGALALSNDEEWQRLKPVLEALKTDMVAGEINISVDTYHPQTAARALECSVAMINDVGGLQNNAMRELLASADCAVTSMHSLSIPADKQHTLPENTVMMQWLEDWVQSQYQLLERSEIDKARVWFDAGIGFGKTAKQSFKLMDAVAQRDHQHERWLMGHSRKSCLNLIAPLEASERNALTRALSAMFMARGVQAVRVHDVAGHVALRTALAL